MSEGIPANFRVDHQNEIGWSADCAKCGKKPGFIALYFGYLDDHLVISGSGCTEQCAKESLWKDYVVKRLRGEDTGVVLV